MGVRQMSATTHADWSRLVADYNEALVRWSETGAAALAVPVGQLFESEQERRHDEALRVLDACEDRLLEASPPDLTAVAMQLKLFAERFHCADLDNPPMAGEDAIAGSVLRRIHKALLSATLQGHRL